MKALAVTVLVALAASCTEVHDAATWVEARTGQAVDAAIPQAHAMSPIVPTEFGRFLATLQPLEVDAYIRALPANVPIEAVQMIPAVGPAYVDSFAKTCTSAAAVTELPSATISYTCQNSSTTKVAVGDSTISDPGTATDAPVYCSTNCPSQEWGGNARQEYCRGDTDTVVVCRALVSLVAAP